MVEDLGPMVHLLLKHMTMCTFCRIWPGERGPAHSASGLL